MANKYFKVTCKCGHVGIKYFIRISFPIVATCGKDASSIARYIPRVKHDHKDAILDCKEISYNEYLELQIINNNDPYLKCACKQEQEMIDNFSSRLELEPRLFSFNAPYGACPECKGLGTKLHISKDLLIPNKDKSSSV